MISSNNIFYHELIGLELKVVESSNDSLVGIRGTVVDETKKTFLIEAESGMPCENIKTAPGEKAQTRESFNLSSDCAGDLVRGAVSGSSDCAGDLVRGAVSGSSDCAGDLVRGAVSGSSEKTLKLIPKDVSVFEFKVPDGTIVEIDGKVLLNRPEDRIKKRYKKI